MSRYDWIPSHAELGADPEPVGTERFERLIAREAPRRRPARDAARTDRDERASAAPPRILERSSA